MYTGDTGSGDQLRVEIEWYDSRCWTWYLVSIVVRGLEGTESAIDFMGPIFYVFSNLFWDFSILDSIIQRWADVGEVAVGGILEALFSCLV